MRIVTKQRVPSGVPSTNVTNAKRTDDETDGVIHSDFERDDSEPV